MRIVRGELDGRDTPRRQRTVEALRRMGITVEPTDTIRKVMWTKFVFIAGFSGVAPGGGRLPRRARDAVSENL